MTDLIAWCGFLGAWLLVAGPLAQGTWELENEELERDTLARVGAAVTKPPPVQRRWLLLPPVYLWLQQRRSRIYKGLIVEAMPARDLEAFQSFREKADAWLFVATGAFLIAIKETWELREAYGWPVSVFWLLVVLMGVGCIVNTGLRIRRRRLVSAAAADGG